MDTSIWIARLIGPVLLAAATPMVAAPRSMTALADDFLQSRPLIYLSGVLVLVAGLAVVNSHNFWHLGWPLILTLLGWAMILGGVARIVAPAAVAKIGQRIIGNPTAIRIGGIVWGLIGAFLSLKGYG